MNKVIFHIDINAFFSTVEEILNPNLKSKPMAVCGRNKHAVICSCNYLARQYGVRAAMRASDAKNLCPNIIFVEPNHNEYSKFSKRFFNFLKKQYAMEMDISSIDECFLDVTNLLEHYHNNEMILATTIQNEVLKNVGLPVSIGISDAPFLAKIASDIKKPLGIYTIYTWEINKKLLPLPIEKYVGIGTKKIKVLHDLNVKTINDLKNSNQIDELKSIFQSGYYEIMSTLNGQNKEYKFWQQEAKNPSLSKAITFTKNENDLERIFWKIDIINEEILDEIKSKNITGFTVTVAIKYTEGTSTSKSKTFHNMINEQNLSNVVKDLFTELWNTEEIKQVSVKLSKLNRV